MLIMILSMKVADCCVILVGLLIVGRNIFANKLSTKSAIKLLVLFVNRSILKSAITL